MKKRDSTIGSAETDPTEGGGDKNPVGGSAALSFAMGFGDSRKLGSWNQNQRFHWSDGSSKGGKSKGSKAKSSKSWSSESWSSESWGSRSKKCLKWVCAPTPFP